tara:strand:- start:164 stop:598 length:435 start_codon:yes stop_codon:yes gene_type:complete
MNIINPNLATNTISVLPRKTYNENPVGDYSDRVLSEEGVVESLDCASAIKAYETVLVLNNEDSDEATYIIPNSVELISNQLVLTIKSPSLKEGQRYSFRIYKMSEEIFRGLILVTEFEQDNYTINNNEFVIDTDTDSDSIPVYE